MKNKSWRKKRIEKRKEKRKDSHIGWLIFDIITDILLFVPELIVGCFRLLFIAFRVLIRMIGDIF
ncbi:hypothetical protein CON36_33510 [Bacillus cereus]|uniref:Uncharacterized protein n=2 Tax=Bacillus cereus group TaxID=86661 RepID=A0A9X6XVB5_BACCE|nr:MULTISPECIES: hypothetical protein [Bacillus cereus group]PDZ94488.1 hypothetical protein CON36_33510 [Bacillus cereus]PFJ29074.1 hypothetical protein COJ15_32945 [Bacillus thuringiensis]